MPTITLTSGDDTYLVNSAGDRTLLFLAGNDTLTVQGGTATTALMGEGNDVVFLKAGPANVSGESGTDRFEIYVGATVDGGTDNDLFNIRGGNSVNASGGLGVDRFNFYGAATNVTINGGDGSDDFYGYNQSITGNIHGGTGNDYFVLFRGSSLSIHGGTGNDIFRADATAPVTFVEGVGEGIDSVQVARGISYILPANIERISVSGFSGSTGAAALLQGNGLSNTITAHNNVDDLWGYGGNDRLFGKGANDTLQGGTGNDYLDGGSGNDVLSGNDGNDVMNGRDGDDAMAGALGNDTFYVDSLTDAVSENGGEGTDIVRVSVTGYTLPDNIETGIVHGDADVTLDGNALDNLMIGGGGYDTLRGGVGNDTLKAGAAGSTLEGGVGDDVLINGYGMIGGPGDDHYFARSELVFLVESPGEGVDTVTVDFGSTYFFGNSFTMADNVENGVISSTGTNDHLIGNGGANILTGNSGNDRLSGAGGGDTILGLGGNDIILGETGNDEINGGDGADYIYGQEGGDSIWGGAGADIFSYTYVSHSAAFLFQSDTIEDFEGGVDTISLFDIDANTTLAGSQAFTLVGSPTGAAGELWITDVGGGDYVILGDVDGGGGDLRIDVHLVSGSTIGIDF